MEDLKNKAKQLEILLRSRGPPKNIDELLHKEQKIKNYLEVKKTLACMQFYNLTPNKG